MNDKGEDKDKDKGGKGRENKSVFYTEQREKEGWTRRMEVLWKVESGKEGEKRRGERDRWGSG